MLGFAHGLGISETKSESLNIRMSDLIADDNFRHDYCCYKPIIKMRPTEATVMHYYIKIFSLLTIIII